MMKKRHVVPLRGPLGVLLGFLVAGATDAAGSTIGDRAPQLAQAGKPAARSDDRRLSMTVGQRRFAVTLADNAAARAFAAQLPLTLDMSDLNANEKKVSLPKPLPTNDTRPGTIRTGDILLWSADTLVVFYETFDSIYSYTRLGWIDDPEGLADVLGKGDVTANFSMN